MTRSRERSSCDDGTCEDCFLAVRCDCKECKLAHEERIRELEEAYLNGDTVEAVVVNLQEGEDEEERSDCEFWYRCSNIDEESSGSDRACRCGCC